MVAYDLRGMVSDDQSGGTVFRVTPAGVLTTRITFTNTLGRYTGLTPGLDGDFYGATFDGGIYDRGSIFRLSVPMPPAFESVTQSNAVIVLTWSSVAGQRYQLQSTSDLRVTNWTNIGGVLYATGGRISVPAPMSPGPARFYRAALLPD